MPTVLMDMIYTAPCCNKIDLLHLGSGPPNPNPEAPHHNNHSSKKRDGLCMGGRDSKRLIAAAEGSSKKEAQQGTAMPLRAQLT
jgi:hypothetical protein